jgi:hypothetical protein
MKIENVMSKKVDGNIGLKVDLNVLLGGDQTKRPTFCKM